MTDKIPAIRESFEQNLVDILQGRPILTKDGEPVMTEDGRVAVARPAATDLAVVRAYLKDLMEPKDDKPSKGAPATGEATGVLGEYLRKNKLPFATTKQ